MRRIVLLWCVVLGLAACGGPAATVDPTAAPSPTAAAPTDAPATAAPTAGADQEPTAAGGQPAIGVIPAPIYFINNENQLARLEIDGTTVTPISDEPGLIFDMAVSQAGGTVAYLMIDQAAGLTRLITTDALGQNRRELAAGSLNSITLSPAGDAVQVGVFYPPPGGAGASPALEPGVWSIPLSGGEPTLLQADTPPSGDASASMTPGTHYMPIAWAPDGQKLLLRTSPNFGPDMPGGDIGSVGLALFEGGAVRQLLPNQSSPLCETASWDPQSVAVYCSASYFLNDETPALWRLNIITGEQEPLVPIKAGETTNIVRNAVELSDGLYSLRGTATDQGPSDFALVRSAQDATSEITALSQDPVPLADGEVLWWDGGGVLLFQEAEGGARDLVWYPFHGGAGPATLLKGLGSSQLAWGKP